MADYKEYKCEGCGYTVNANPKGNNKRTVPLLHFVTVTDSPAPNVTKEKFKDYNYDLSDW